MESASRRPPEFRQWFDARRDRSRRRIQDDEVWRLLESAVAIASARGQSRHLSSGADHDDAAATRRCAAGHGSHALLSRTLARCVGVIALRKLRYTLFSWK